MSTSNVHFPPLTTTASLIPRTEALPGKTGIDTRVQTTAFTIPAAQTTVSHETAVVRYKPPAVKPTDPFSQKIEELLADRNENLDKRGGVPGPTILFSGRGPASLIRAVIALINGNKVIVLEKHSAYKERRANPIYLNGENISILRDVRLLVRPYEALKL